MELPFVALRNTLRNHVFNCYYRDSHLLTIKLSHLGRVYLFYCLQFMLAFAIAMGQIKDMFDLKGLLLLFGVYMAWETKHVKIPALSDSRYIAMNIYNVVLCSLTVVTISMVISDRPTLSHCVTSAILVMSTTVLLCLLFLPKV